MPKTNINLLIRDIQRNFDNHAIAFDVHALYEHPLHVLIKIAAEHTDLRVYLIGCIDALLRQGADINQLDANGNTPLHLVINHKHHATWIEYFLEVGANINTTNHIGQHTFTTAACSDFYDHDTLVLIMKTMFNQINRKLHLIYNNQDNIEETLRNEINYHAGLLIINHAPTKIVNTILSLGEYLNVPIQADYNNLIEPLGFILSRLDIMALDNPNNLNRFLEHLSVLSVNDVDFNVSDKDGNGPLHMLIHYFDPKFSIAIIRHLLTLGADINMTNFLNETPLHHTSHLLFSRLYDSHDVVNLVEFMVQSGADVFAPDLEGERSPFVLLMAYASMMKDDALEKLIHVFYEAGVDFFAINTSGFTNSIYFREYDLRTAEMVLDVTLANISKHLQGSERINFFYGLFQTIFTIHVHNGPEKLTLFINKAEKYGLIIDHDFITAMVNFKRFFTNENISDDQGVLTTMMRGYKPTNFDLFIHQIAQLCLEYDAQYTQIFIEHAVKYIQKNTNSVENSRQLNTLFSHLLNQLMHENIPKKMLICLNIFEKHAVHIDDNIIKTFKTFIENHPNSNLANNAGLFNKLLGLYEPSNQENFKKQIKALNSTYKLNNKTHLVKNLKIYYKSIKHATMNNRLPASFYAFNLKIDAATTQGKDFEHMLSKYSHLLANIESQLKKNKSNPNTSPLIRKITNQILMTNGLNKNKPLVGEFQTIFYEFLDQAEIRNLIIALGIFKRKFLRKEKSIMTITP